MKHRSATMLYVIAATAAIWGAALAQRPAAEEGTLLDKLKQIEERLTSVEKALARQVETDA